MREALASRYKEKDEADVFNAPSFEVLTTEPNSIGWTSLGKLELPVSACPS